MRENTLSGTSSSHEYAARRTSQRMGRMLESVAFALDVPMWILDDEGEVMHKSASGTAACEFIQSCPRGLSACLDFHRASMQELTAFREPVVKVCPMGMGKILVPLRIENRLIGAIAVFPLSLPDYTPGEEERRELVASILGRPHSPELAAVLQSVRAVAPQEMQQLVRLLTVLGEEVTSASFELADTVTQLVATYDELALLYRVTQMIGMESAVDDICDLLLEEVRHMLSPRRAFVMLLDENRQHLVMRRTIAGDTYMERLRLFVGEGRIGAAALTGESFILNSLGSDPLQDILPDARLGSVAVSVMKTGERILGVLVAADKTTGEDFVANDLKFLQALSGPAAIALENARLNEERIRAEREQAWSGVAFAAAHKIGNALFALEGYLRRLPDLLSGPSPDVEGMKSALKGAQHTANTMKRIIQEFKNFARADTLDISSVDINSLLHELGSRWAMQGKMWTVEKHLDARLPTVAGDANRLEQIFEELLENAWHAMPEGGTLCLRSMKATTEQLDHFGLSRQSEAVVVEITDTGPGIPAADKGRIFESFFTTHGTGTGLGLAIVRKYVELHGGRIEERGIPGQGARFVIILPVDGVHAQQGEDGNT